MTPQNQQPKTNPLAQSLDIAGERKAQLKMLFPDAFSEGKLDIKRLTAALEASGINTTTPRENYELTWAGKSEARAEIQKRSTATLRPDMVNSVHWDATQNLYIEGENLEVLRVLQKAYFGKVKMVYIDPPYNTGNDSFVYPDHYSETLKEYQTRTQQTDENGFVNKQTLWKKNTKENGQFHSVWLSMMYPRLFLARNLLREDGVIFVSIDDNEAADLKLLMDEIFGEENFEAIIIPISNPGGRDYKQVAITHEYLIAFSKSPLSELNELQKDMEFPFKDTQGGYQPRELRNRNPKFNSNNRPRLFYSFFVNPSITMDGYCAVSLEKNSNYSIEVKPYNSQGNESVWRWGQKKSNENIVSDDIDKSQIVAKQKSDGNWNIYEKSRRTTTKVKSLWSETSMRTEDGTRAFRSLFEKSYFEHPKSIELVKRCIQVGLNDEDIMLDFFSGSGTAAQAVLELNEEDGGKRQFICVQMPELLDSSHEAYKAGYRTIADIGRARIKKVIERIEAKRNNADTQTTLDQALKEEGNETPQALGFNAFKLAPSNFKEWRTDVDNEADLLAQLEYHIDSTKPGSEERSMVYELLLKLAMPVTTPVHCQTIDIAHDNIKGKLQTRVYVANLDNVNSMVFIFQPVTREILDLILDIKPVRVLCLNRCFEDSQALTNFSLQLQDADIALEVL